MTIHRVIQNSARFTPCCEFRHFLERFPQSARASIPRRIAGHVPNQPGDYSTADLQNAPQKSRQLSKQLVRNAIDRHPTSRTPAGPADYPQPRPVAVSASTRSRCTASDISICNRACADTRRKPK